MPIALACASHTPLMRQGECPEDVRRAVTAGFAALANTIRDFAPDLVVQFSPDHFNGFFYDVMPAFCVGIAADSVGDWETKTGPLPVPEAEAVALATALLADGIDVATSYRMRVDHGFVQIWEALSGAFDAVPLIPIFVNCAAPPLPSFHRARLLGEAVGRFAARSDKRVLVVASGGLSHDPPVPRIAQADAALRERLIANRNPTAAETAARRERVLAAGRAALAGDPGILAVSPDWDRDFLARLRDGAIEQFDDWSAADLVAVAGRGGPETLCWIAAMAALRTAGTVATELHFYQAIQGWVAGMAILSGHTIS